MTVMALPKWLIILTASLSSQQRETPIAMGFVIWPTLWSILEILTK
jgi:hypothetical protein